MPRAIALTLAIVLVGTTVPAGAQGGRSFDVQRWAPAPDSDSFLSITGTRTPGPFRWNLALWLDYAQSPYIVRLEDGTRIPMVGDRIGGDLLFQLGLFGIVGVVIDAPLVIWQDGAPERIDGGPGLMRTALRDPRIAARVRLLGEDATQERERHEGEGLGIQVSTTLPIGHTGGYAGEGAPQLEAQLLGDFHILDIGVGGMAGVRHRFGEPQLLGVRFRNELIFGIGVQVPTFVIDRVLALIELNVATDLENPFGNEASTVVDWLFGIRLGLPEDLVMTLAAGSGLTGGVGTTSLRVIAGVSWSPRVHDRDRDGILDEDDECATLPEDFDEHLDEDGCPEPDNDGDLVPDLDDRCPNAAATFELDSDDDGCNDEHPDADGDGVEDPGDACAELAEDLDGHEDTDGCPDLDDDGDGIPDDSDGCRLEPEDADGDRDQDGCPDAEAPDGDGDGVADDRCPDEAEDVDGHEDGDGCPELDNDRDGAPDSADRCPEAREDIDGRADDDGCPEPGGRAVWQVSGTPGEVDYVLLGAIRFLGDGSIWRFSLPALDQLARHLIASAPRPMRVRVGGATDAQLATLRQALVERGASMHHVELMSRPEGGVEVRGVEGSD